MKSGKKREFEFISKSALFIMVFLAVSAVFLVASLFSLEAIPSLGEDDELQKLRSSYGALGDYFGGLLNPIFSFLGLGILLWTLRLTQKDLNETRKALYAQERELKIQRITNVVYKQSEAVNVYLEKISAIKITHRNFMMEVYFPEIRRDKGLADRKGLDGIDALRYFFEKYDFNKIKENDLIDPGGFLNYFLCKRDFMEFVRSFNSSARLIHSLMISDFTEYDEARRFLCAIYQSNIHGFLEIEKIAQGFYSYRDFIPEQKKPEGEVMLELHKNIRSIVAPLPE